MNEELEKKLITAYPKIFINTNKHPHESVMAFGCECGDGWYNILDDLCYALSYLYEAYAEVNPRECIDVGPPPQVIAMQVKEKFGELRFYYTLEFSDTFKSMQEKYPDNKGLERWAHNYRDYCDGMIHLASIISARTCEVTGKRGQTYHRGGWFKTLCEEKAKELGYTLLEDKSL